MPTRTRSYATRRGNAFYEINGRYNEFTKEAKSQFKNGTSPSLNQKHLTQAGSATGAATSTNKAKKELGL